MATKRPNAVVTSASAMPAEAAGAGEGHALERVDDAGDGAEEPDERRRRRDRGEVAEAFLHLRRRHQRLAVEGALARLDEVEVRGQLFVRLVLELRQAGAQHAGE